MKNLLRKIRCNRHRARYETALLVWIFAGFLFGASCADRHRLSQISMFKRQAFHAPVITGWDYDTNSDDAMDFGKRDTDNDGVIDTYRYDTDYNGSLETSHIKGAALPARHLVIFIDSIPYDLMEELWEDGYFRDFFSPGRVISTFPSDTNPAFTEMFDTEPMPGIEDRYYDRKRNKVVGGKWDHIVRRYKKSDTSFHAFFDYEQHPRYGALIYLLPYPIADHDIEQCYRAYWKTLARQPDKDPVILYIGSTDAIGHKKGRAGMRRQLLKIEQMINEIIYKTRGTVQISLISDHGNNLVKSNRIAPLGKALAEHAYELSNTSINGDRSIVIPRFGLVNDVCVYTGEADKEKVADILAHTPGVDFALYEKEGDYYVIDEQGNAKISARDTAYRYETLTGDPFDLGDVIVHMQQSNMIDKDGFAQDADWFTMTKNHRYPDIIKRSVTALTNHAINRPDVFLSLKDGYCYGNPLFNSLITLLGTHGAATDTSSNGIVMNTHRPSPDYVRISDVLRTLGIPQGNGDHEAEQVNGRTVPERRQPLPGPPE
jgi:hypothetical protein